MHSSKVAPAASALLFVALTAAAGEREVEALLEAGAVACIGKDQPLDTIVDAVRSAARLETAG